MIKQLLALFLKKRILETTCKNVKFFVFGPAKFSIKFFEKKRFLVNFFGPIFSGFSKNQKVKKVKNHEKLLQKTVCFLLSEICPFSPRKAKNTVTFFVQLFARLFRLFQKKVRSEKTCHFWTIFWSFSSSARSAKIF